MSQYESPKRKRGGQPRNLNAFKHGLYSKPFRCVCVPEEDFYRWLIDEPEELNSTEEWSSGELLPDPSMEERSEAEIQDINDIFTLTL